MIQELTVDNLIRLGLTETDANKLFNEDSYTLQCNAGNFYTSKAENRIYTGSDFWIFVYLTNNLSFPFQAPELTQKYFSLSLKNFLETKKEKLKSLYNEIFETQNFITKETDFAIERILYWQNKKLTTKENLIDVLKGYLYFLENYKVESDKKEVIETENKLTINQIALKLVYENALLTREKSNEIIIQYGHKSGEKLYQSFNFYQNRNNRTANPDKSKKILENKIKLFERVIDLLGVNFKQKATDECNTLKTHLLKY
jgi:hypothetical protein